MQYSWYSCDKICFPNEIEDVNLKAFNMINGTNESRVLTKYMSWKYKCKFVGRKCNSNQKRNNNKCRCEFKNLRKHYVCKKGYDWNPSTCTYENGKYLV